MNRLPTDILKMVYRYLYDYVVIRKISEAVDWYESEWYHSYDVLKKSRYGGSWSRYYRASSLLLIDKISVYDSKIRRNYCISIINGNIYCLVDKDIPDRHYKLTPLKEGVANCWATLKEITENVRYVMYL